MEDQLPKYFKSILWSYDFSKVDPDKMKRIIIINAINYGDLKHWNWIINYYGKDEVLSVVDHASEFEVREGAKKLLDLIYREKHEKVSSHK